MVRVVRTGRKKQQFIALSVFLFLPFVCTAGSGGLNLQKRASFDTRLNVPEAIKSGCQLESRLIDFIESSVKEDFEAVTFIDTVTGSETGKTLAVIITDLSSGSGGAWSGPKHLTIEGTLWQDGKIIGTFTASRVAGGAARGSYMGTCSLLSRCARTLGKDVALWLQNPSMNARLGDQ